MLRFGEDIYKVMEESCMNNMDSNIRIFRSKLTGHVITCNIVKDVNLIKDLEKSKDYSELMYI